MIKYLKMFKQEIQVKTAGKVLLVGAGIFVATAALMAMSVRGVRIPEDVKVASWVNVGVGVPYPKTMAGFYFNLRGAGIRLAQYALDVLDGKSLPEDAAVEIEYRNGETFPH